MRGHRRVEGGPLVKAHNWWKVRGDCETQLPIEFARYRSTSGDFVVLFEDLLLDGALLLALRADLLSSISISASTAGIPRDGQ